METRLAACDDLVSLGDDDSLLPVILMVESDSDRLSSHVRTHLQDHPQLFLPLCLRILQASPEHELACPAPQEHPSPAIRLRGHAALILGLYREQIEDTSTYLVELLFYQDERDREGWVSQCAAQAIADLRTTSSLVATHIQRAFHDIWDGTRTLHHPERLLGCLFVAYRYAGSAKNLPDLLRFMHQNTLESFEFVHDVHRAAIAFIENLFPERSAPPELLAELPMLRELLFRQSFSPKHLVDLLLLLGRQSSEALRVIADFVDDPEVDEATKQNVEQCLLVPLSEEFDRAEFDLLMQLVCMREGTVGTFLGAES